MWSYRGEIYVGGSLATYPGSVRATISNDATVDSLITELVDPDIHPWSSDRWCGTVTRTWCGTSCVLRRILRRPMRALLHRSHQKRSFGRLWDVLGRGAVLQVARVWLTLARQRDVGRWWLRRVSTQTIIWQIVNIEPTSEWRETVRQSLFWWRDVWRSCSKAKEHGERRKRECHKTAALQAA